MDQLTVGTVPCDFVSRSDFYRRCTRWFQSQSFHHVVTLNAEMIVEAARNTQFAIAVRSADIRTPDGFGMWCAYEYLTAPGWSSLSRLLRLFLRPRERISGVDMIVPLADIAARCQQSVYLVGGTGVEAQLTRIYIRQHVPNVTVHVAPDHVFHEEGPKALIFDIQAKKPGLLLVAYGAPKQTFWIEQHRTKLPSVRVAVGVGGAFTILSGILPRAPRLFRKRFEWFWRLMVQPSRLPRIYRAVITFPLLVYRQKNWKSDR